MVWDLDAEGRRPSLRDRSDNVTSFAKMSSNVPQFMMRHITCIPKFKNIILSTLELYIVPVHKHTFEAIMKLTGLELLGCV